MGSKSRSSQKTTYNTETNYSYQMLDGGAIHGAFNFANTHSDRAFDSTDNAVNKAFGFGGEAFEFGEYVAGEAFDSIGQTFDKALTHSAAQMDQMSDLVKSTQTQGATELINANKETAKVMYITVAVVLLAVLLMIFIAGRKR